MSHKNVLLLSKTLLSPMLNDSTTDPTSKTLLFPIRNADVSSVLLRFSGNLKIKEKKHTAVTVSTEINEIL